MRKMEYEELEQILNERKDNEKLELRDLEFDDYGSVRHETFTI